MAIQEYTNDALFDLRESIARDNLIQYVYPWEVLPHIKEIILKIGETLPPDRFEKKGKDIWIARSAHVFDSAYIAGPCIIDEDVEVRHGAFIRGSALVGKGCVVGNSCELKNVILFNQCEVPHYNYVGDSILGFHAHMGAGSITSNIKSDRTNVVIHEKDDEVKTGLRKMGAILGDYTEIGCNSVLNPGSITGKYVTVYPLSMVRGCIPAFHIFKDKDHIVLKNKE